MEEMRKVCKYFMPVVEVKKGRCRHWPTTINTTWTGSNPLGFYTNNPAVYDDQWCDEFLEAPPEPS